MKDLRNAVARYNSSTADEREKVKAEIDEIVDIINFANDNPVSVSEIEGTMVIRPAIRRLTLENVASDISDNKNDDVRAHIMYDESDGNVWVDFLLSGERKVYESETVHEVEWDDFDYHTIEITGGFVVNAEALVHYFTKRLGYEVV